MFAPWAWAPRSGAFLPRNCHPSRPSCLRQRGPRGSRPQNAPRSKYTMRFVKQKMTSSRSGVNHRGCEALEPSDAITNTAASLVTWPGPASASPCPRAWPRRLATPSAGMSTPNAASSSSSGAHRQAGCGGPARTAPGWCGQVRADAGSAGAHEVHATRSATGSKMSVQGRRLNVDATQRA